MPRRAHWKVAFVGVLSWGEVLDVNVLVTFAMSAMSNAFTAIVGVCCAWGG